MTARTHSTGLNRFPLLETRTQLTSLNLPILRCMETQLAPATIRLEEKALSGRHSSLRLFRQPLRFTSIRALVTAAAVGRTCGDPRQL